MNIFVSRLSNTTTSEDLKKLFEQYGEVEYAKVIFDTETKKSKCYAFVKMQNEAEAKVAIKSLNFTKVDKNTIKVKKSIPTNTNKTNT